MKHTLALALVLTGCAPPTYRVIEYDANSWYFGLGSGVVGGCRVEIGQAIPEGVSVEYSGEKCRVKKDAGNANGAPSLSERQ